MRTKYIPFQFSFDIKNVQNYTGTISMFKTGELLIEGRAAVKRGGVDASDGSEAAEINIEVDSIMFNDVNIISVIRMDGCHALMRQIKAQAQEMIENNLETMPTRKPRKKQNTLFYDFSKEVAEIIPPSDPRHPQHVKVSLADPKKLESDNVEIPE